MNIPPLLERLLLSNEAVFKNASLGMSGDNMVYIPPGKTGVILEVSIEPFCNVITNNAMLFFTQGFFSEGNESLEIIWRQFIRRLHYQLQIINDKYQTYINLADSFSLNGNTNIAGNTLKSDALASLHFTGKREELFIYVDRSIYFNLIYPYKETDEGTITTGLTPTYDTPVNGFLAKIQTIPDSPVTFNNNINQDYVVNVQVNTSAADHYYPVNHQSSALYPELPQMEYLRFFASGFNESTIQQPVASGSELLFHDLFSIPFINVKYALLNKRPDDYGITMPTKS